MVEIINDKVKNNVNDIVNDNVVGYEKGNSDIVNVKEKVVGQVPYSCRFSDSTSTYVLIVIISYHGNYKKSTIILS